jgi:hypothetical protein
MQVVMRWEMILVAADRSCGGGGPCEIRCLQITGCYSREVTVISMSGIALFSNMKPKICEISGFYRDVHEICAILGCYAA